MAQALLKSDQLPAALAESVGALDVPFVEPLPQIPFPTRVPTARDYVVTEKGADGVTRWKYPCETGREPHEMSYMTLTCVRCGRARENLLAL